MRVLHLSLGYNSGGAERCARELFENLPDLGIQTEMWIGRYTPNLPPRVAYVPRYWERFLRPLEFVPDLTDWCHRGSIPMLDSITRAQFDLVHLHNIYGGWLSMKSLTALTERFPCVWTLHDEWAPSRGVTSDLTEKMTRAEVRKLTSGPFRYIPYDRYHENFKWRRTRKLLDRWMPRPRVVISPSSHIAQLAMSSGVFPHSKIVHIPNGTKMPDIGNARMNRAEAKTSFGLSAHSPVVLMVAADLGEAHKGMMLAIQVLKAINPEIGMQVFLLGRSARPIQEALRPLRTASAFARDDETLARAYRAADLTIIPSLAENFPYVGLESLACGTPLVAFPVGGMPEMIGRNERGLICGSIDTLEMTGHISQLLRDGELRERLGSRGRDWVNEHCGMTRYLRAIADLYADILAEGRPRAGDPAQSDPERDSKI